MQKPGTGGCRALLNLAANRFTLPILGCFIHSRSCIRYVSICDSIDKLEDEIKEAFDIRINLICYYFTRLNVISILYMFLLLDSSYHQMLFTVGVAFFLWLQAV